MSPYKSKVTMNYLQSYLFLILHSRIFSTILQLKKQKISEFDSELDARLVLKRAHNESSSFLQATVFNYSCAFNGIVLLQEFEKTYSIFIHLQTAQR